MIKKLVSFITAVFLCAGFTMKVSADESTLFDFYDFWKKKYLVRDEYVSGEDQYYVKYSEESYSGGDRSVPVTVSEAHGYGMLVLTYMSGYDSESRELFDGMYRFYRSHLSSIGPNLMSWQQCDNGKALIDGADDGEMTGGSCDSASDGDMDIAYSLLLADKIWGSDGQINYRSAAIDMINDIMEYDVNHELMTVNLGDWVSECGKDEIYYGAVRSSDFITQYTPCFAQVTGDSRWLEVYNKTYDIIEEVSSRYDTGLLPDFIVYSKEENKYEPAPENFLEGETDGIYSYNSCRTPWRISMDYICSGSERALSAAEKMNRFIIGKTGGDPEHIVAGYTPDGQEAADYSELCFTAPFMVSAKLSGDSEWENAVNSAVENWDDDVYYGDTLKLLCLAAYYGYGIYPVESTGLKGDIDLDSKVSVSDAVLLSETLLGIKKVSEKQLERADMNEDKTINVFDLILLRRYIIETEKFR
ncbi:MAG: glycosyl hydrolase family 8 [Porcipelethomonas sp.]